MKNIEKKYSKEDLTVIWKPDQCIHSEKCFKGLSHVFNPNQRPWINLDKADNDKIRDQVDQCPSGALSYEKPKEATVPGSEAITIQILAQGPILVKGTVKIQGVDGQITESGQSTAFCRCGLSSNKPFCDGSHKSFDFDDA
ncbi:(4Fe-4S)-binding protein [Fulvivirgaceae bacterium BMA12]|uniref:(4Fe-4S)-binding protein n=1 Tax=Agaribacillus aureus TaxID=3051825 RepID=A0ABT8LC64_9BACT|nr:(4Fe-4S)-binding protein [Fulvivirgaceae bacterium BMA12]